MKPEDASPQEKKECGWVPQTLPLHTEDTCMHTARYILAAALTLVTGQHLQIENCPTLAAMYPADCWAFALL